MSGELADVIRRYEEAKVAEAAAAQRSASIEAGRAREQIARILGLAQPAHVPTEPVFISRAPAKARLLDAMRSGPMTSREAFRVSGVSGNYGGPLLTLLKKQGLIRKTGKRRWELVPQQEVTP